MIIPVPIPSLPVQNPPLPIDLILLVSGGVAYQAALGNILSALAVATTLSKGLMSATDKLTLDQLTQDVVHLIAPLAVTIASAASITVPAEKYFVIITGTTTITSITLPVKGVTFSFYYPAGAGVTIIGNPVQAGDAPLQIQDTL